MPGFAVPAPTRSNTTSGRRALELLREIFGPDSDEVERYEDATEVRGRLPGVRGQAGNMTLNIHGQWGILGRLDRGETVLKELVAQLN